jgi:hypothetical protein
MKFLHLLFTALAGSATATVPLNAATTYTFG